MARLSQEDKELLNRCVHHAQTCITACQYVIDMCSANNSAECAAAVGTCVKHCAECIETCHEVIKFCDFQARGSDDQMEKQRYIDCKKACQNAIAQCKKTIAECKAANQECTDACVACIKACTAVAQTCAALID